MKKIIYIIYFLIPILVFSQEKEVGKIYDGWTYIDTNENGDDYYYKIRNEKSVWFKTSYKKIKKHSTLFNEYETKGYLVLFMFDCKNEKLSLQSSGHITEEGVVDTKQNSDEVTKNTMEIPFPDTMEEWYLDFYCNTIKKN